MVYRENLVKSDNANLSNTGDSEGGLTVITDGNRQHFVDPDFAQPSSYV